MWFSRPTERGKLEQIAKTRAIEENQTLWCD